MKQTKIDHKQLENELQKSKKMFTFLLDSIDASIYVTDIKTNEILYANKYLRNIFGDIEGKICWQVLQDHQTGPCSFCNNDKLLTTDGKTSGVYHWEFENTVNGRWYDIRDLAIEWVDDRIVRLEIATDITERKKAEKMLGESEKHYRTLFEDNPYAIQEIDSIGTIIYANKAHGDMYGYEESELIGQSVIDFLVPDVQRNELPSYLAILVKDQPPPTIYHQKILTKHGIERNIEVAWNYMRDLKGNVKGFISVLTDITERKETEDALKSSEKKFKLLAEKSPNMIFINKKGRVAYVNEKCVEIMGYAREEYYSENFNFMDLIAPESIDLVKENFSKHMQGEAIPSYEYKIIKKSGEAIFAIHSTVLIDFENEKAIVGIATDITERKMVEDKMKEARDELESRVIERTLELQEKNVALKVLLKQREEDKNDIEQNILSNVKSLVQPYIQKLKRNNSNLEDISYLNLIESNLEDIISPFSQKLSSNYMKFSAKEIEIANLIKEGKKNKEIMEIMSIAFDTVKAHRRNIRKKLGIYNKATNLRNKLLSM